MGSSQFDFTYKTGKYLYGKFKSGKFPYISNPWTTAYKDGYNPVEYGSPAWYRQQILSATLPGYKLLYKFGGSQAYMDQYAKNTQWNGIVQHPGTTSYGGVQDLYSGTVNFVSDNIRWLYK